MWLDRISGHSTPSAPQFDSRSSSPVPRRSSHLSPLPQNNRPGSSRQGSSLSTLLTSNDSNTSLPPTAPGANGKQGIAGKRPSDVVDPLEVLNGIISKRKADKPGATLSNRDSAPAVKPPRLVDTIDFGELVWRNLLRKRINASREGF